jgi:DNA repair protein RadC
MTTRRLFVAEPGGEFKAAADGDVIRAATAAIGRALARGPKFDSPSASRKFLPALLGHLDYEVFCLAHLDKRHRLIKFEQLFRGTIDGASVFPREIVRSVIAHNSACVLLVHNHPSGEGTASAADELITTRIREALALIDVRMLDHLIVHGDSITSFAERGLL